MGGPGSGKVALDVRFVVVSHKGGRTTRRYSTHDDLDDAVVYADSLIKARLADRYHIDRVETLVRRGPPDD